MIINGTPKLDKRRPDLPRPKAKAICTQPHVHDIFREARPLIFVHPSFPILSFGSALFRPELRYLVVL
jgi:hypothetical protein